MKLNFFGALAGICLLTGCAPPLDNAQMRPMANVIQQIPANTMLERSINIGKVSVPDDYNQSSVGSFDSAGFKSALQEGFLIVNYLPRQGDEPKYTLEANLLELDIPKFGFAMDASCTVSYTLTRNSNSAQVFKQTIKQSYHAGLAESWNGGERARLASEKAVRENITHLVRVLANLNQKDLEGK